MACRAGLWIGATLLTPALALAAPPPREPAFAVPADRAAWAARRGEVRRDALDALGLDPTPERPEAVAADGPAAEAEGVRVTRLTVRGPGGRAVPARYYVPAGPQRAGSLPAVLFLSTDPVGSPDVPTPTPPDAADPPASLARKGYAVLLPLVRHDPKRLPWLADEPDRPEAPPDGWGDTLRDDRLAFTALAGRPEVDPKRVGVLGVGLGGMRAWWLAALDERVACAGAAGGVTRIGDWRGDQHPHTPALAAWANSLLGKFDTEALVALCAPRPIQLLSGDRDPVAPVSGFYTLRNTGIRAYRLYGVPGPGSSLFGGLDGRFHLLEWDALTETFDKAFLPQGPTPLGHEPEPEPKVDSRWVNPAETGLAGWAVEMSQRPGTWTWADGVIACKPGRAEYGWLRLPVELDDFLFQVEWRCPPRGNTGIFLRAKPVPWTFPPSDENKTRVIGLGLDWPSRSGLELQAQDDPGHADKYSSGSLYRHAAPSSNPTKPAGEWNRYTVRARGPRVEVWVNGTQVLDARLDRLPSLRTPPLSGYVGLQNHGSPAEFRNVRYLKLTPEAATAGREEQ